MSAPPYTPFRENGKAGGPRCYDLRYRPFDPDAGQERYIACYRDAWRGAHGTTEGFNASACWLSAQLHSAEAPGCITEALVIATALYFCLTYPTSKVIAHFEKKMSAGSSRNAANVAHKRKVQAQEGTK